MSIGYVYVINNEVMGILEVDDLKINLKLDRWCWNEIFRECKKLFYFFSYDKVVFFKLYFLIRVNIDI